MEDKLMTKQEMKDKIDFLNEKVNELFQESCRREDGWNWYKSQPELKTLQQLERQYKLLLDESDFNLHDIPDYGDKISLEDFILCCKSGAFINYDGFGCYATETQESDIEIYPSDVVANEYRKDFPFIIWYNR